MSTVVTPADEARNELGASFAGQLIGPNDSEYDEARVLFNAMIDKRPALVARCASPEDVAATIGFARRHDLPLAIHGGGHNGGGLGSVDDGVVAHLSLLKEMVAEESQFIIATHSPILMAFPEATLLSFDAGSVRELTYGEVEQVELLRSFLAEPAAFLRHL